MPESGGEVATIVEGDIPVRMRDGTILRANVFRPTDRRKHPGILMRTPYGKAEGGFDRYVQAGYVVAVQDTRGRYASEGTYVPFEAEETGDAQDGFDSVEWLAAQPYCDGNVGTMGGSYCAWMQWMLAALRPPHLRAMCAYSIPVELTDLDYPGAFRPARRVHWWMVTMSPDIRRRRGLPGPHTVAEARRIWDEVEAARWLYLLPWAELPEFLPEGLAEHVERWLANPSSRPWKFDEAHSRVEVPNLDFSGWFDHCCSTMGHLAGMQRHARTEAARKGSRLIIGPWSHASMGQGRPRASSSVPMHPLTSRAR